MEDSCAEAGARLRSMCLCRVQTLSAACEPRRARQGTQRAHWDWGRLCLAHCGLQRRGSPAPYSAHAISRNGKYGCKHGLEAEGMHTHHLRREALHAVCECLLACTHKSKRARACTLKGTCTCTRTRAPNLDPHARTSARTVGHWKLEIGMGAASCAMMAAPPAVRRSFLDSVSTCCFSASIACCQPALYLRARACVCARMRRRLFVHAHSCMWARPHSHTRSSDRHRPWRTSQPCDARQRRALVRAETALTLNPAGRAWCHSVPPIGRPHPLVESTGHTHPLVESTGHTHHTWWKAQATRTTLWRA